MLSPIYPSLYGPLATAPLPPTGPYTPRPMGGGGGARGAGGMGAGGSPAVPQMAQQAGQGTGQMASSLGMLSKSGLFNSGRQGLLDVGGLTGAQPDMLAGPMTPGPGTEAPAGLLGGNAMGADPGALNGMTIGGAGMGSPLSLSGAYGASPSMWGSLRGYFGA